LSEPEREDKLRSSHEKLGYESLEETSDTLVLHHTANDLESSFRVVKISVLDTGFDNIEGSRDN
jgi:hypothetical protein